MHDNATICRGCGAREVVTQAGSFKAAMLGAVLFPALAWGVLAFVGWEPNVLVLGGAAVFGLYCGGSSERKWQG